MKRILFIKIISIIFLLISCQNTKKPSESNNNIEDKVFYIEFIHSENPLKYSNYIELVKKELFKNSYIADKDFKRGNQGIRKIDANEQITKKDISQYHPNIHKFIDFSEYNSNSEDVEKIVITLNKSINDSIPNFNFRSYKKNGFKDWQYLSNPGNFRYTKSNPNESELSNWMIRTITLLTFK